MAKEMLDLFIEDLRDTYSAEKQASRAMQRVLKKIQHEGLRQAFEEHIEETDGQIERLEQVFEEVETKPRAKTCHAMQGLIEEQKEVLDMELEAELQDAALIVSQQKAEHYEIAAYGSLAAYAKALGLERAAELLHETLDEESRFDARLTELAESEVNPAALSYEEGDEEDEEGEGEEGEDEEEDEEGLEVQDEKARGRTSGRGGGGGQGSGRREKSSSSRARSAPAEQRNQRRNRTTARSKRAAE